MNNNKKIEDLPSVLSVSEIAEYLNISKAKAYTLFDQNGFPKIKHLGKLKRVKKNDFITWLDS